MPFSIAGPASPALPSLDGINRATDRLSSGLRADYQQNSAETAISGRLDSANGETTIALRNAIQQTSALQKADQTLSQGTDIVERIRALQVQAGNGSLSESDKANIQQQSQGLLEAYSETLRDAEFNGNPLFADEAADLQSKLDNSETLSTDELDDISEELNRLQAEVGAEQNALNAKVDQLTSSGTSSDASDLAENIVNLLQEQIQYEASVKVFDQQRLAEESILDLLS